MSDTPESVPKPWWCDACDSWRHTMLCGRDECPRPVDTAPAREWPDAVALKAAWMEGYEAGRSANHAERDAALRQLVLDLQAHAKEHGWQDYDEPIAALLAWQPSASQEIAAPQEDTLRGFIEDEIIHATELTTSEVTSLVHDILAAIREHERQRRALASRASSQEIAGNGESR